ncbi:MULTISPECIES: hypothetical protein [unclassified Rickettsia]|uniref:hypothetical protein n=1 Tax=unclassified Rickettsia TaxID=114295 RepID=UPI00117A1D5A|nr:MULTISPECIES: hypothetical protein [unclassified Rickettsia]
MTGENDPRNNALRRTKLCCNLVKLPEIASSKLSVSSRNDNFLLYTTKHQVNRELSMRLSKAFVDFLIKLPKDHREFKDYFAQEEKNIEFFKNISDKNQLIEILTYSGHYSQIKENIQEIEAYLLGQYNYGCSGV